MRTGRRHTGLIVLLASFTLTGCTPVQKSVPLDKNGNPIPTPGPYDTWLQVTNYQPSSHHISPAPIVRVRFSTYLDTHQLQLYNTLLLASGSIYAYGQISYDMTHRTLIWEPFRPITPDLVYELTFNDKALRSETGAPLDEPEKPIDYYVTADITPPTDTPLPDVRWARVRSIFQQKCDSCHADPKWGINPLTYDGLVGKKSSEEDLYLVRPYHAPDSYLMQKILWDYPVRRFSAQPPPWSKGAKELPKSDESLIEDWIDEGAKK